MIFLSDTAPEVPIAYAATLIILAILITAILMRAQRARRKLEAASKDQDRAS